MFHIKRSNESININLKFNNYNKLNIIRILNGEN